MHSGLLTGKVSKEWFSSLPENDWRKHKVDHPVVSPLQTEDGMEKFIVFQSELQRFQKIMGDQLVSLPLHGSCEREKLLAIVGARKKGQISQICGVSQTP